MTSRAFFSVRSWFVILVMGLAVLAVPSARAFEVFYAGMYSDTPDFSGYGIKTAKIFYPNEIWLYSESNDLAPNQQDVDRVVARYLDKRAMPADMIVLDIEHWSVSDDSQQVNSLKLSNTITRFKKHFPSTMVGFYGLIPDRAFYEAQKNAPSWRETNSRLKPLAKHVDAIFPSLYSLSSDQEKWARFAANTLREAQQYDKPVYAFVWPQYHQSVRFKGGEFIDSHDWRRQLLLIREYADGVVIWGGWDVNKKSGNKRMAWDPDAPWWRATLEFLEEESVEQLQ